MKDVMAIAGGNPQGGSPIIDAQQKGAREILKGRIVQDILKANDVDAAKKVRTDYKTVTEEKKLNSTQKKQLEEVIKNDFPTKLDKDGKIQRIIINNDDEPDREEDKPPSSTP